jgi:hypothetical protein
VDKLCRFYAKLDLYYPDFDLALLHVRTAFRLTQTRLGDARGAFRDGAYLENCDGHAV